MMLPRAMLVRARNACRSDAGDTEPASSVDVPAMPNSPRCVLAALIGLALGACLYDADHRCGPAMTFVDAANACVCNANAVPVQGGCQVCAADEVVSSDKCACPPGQSKNADNLCTNSALGRACDTATNPCTDAVYSYCAVKHGGTAGTCTNRCTSNADCSAVYTCAKWEAQPYCRTFDGFGASCTATPDCTGDTNFCDTFQTHRCGIQGCSLTLQDCPRDTLCCDFSQFSLGMLCAGACL